MRTRLLALAAVTMSFGMVVIALAQDANTPLPDPVFKKLVTDDAAFLNKALAKGKVTEKIERKVKAVALMIAAYAQSKQGTVGKASAADLALRDTALSLIKAVKGKKMAEAKALAAKLSVKINPEPGTRPAVVPLHTHLKFEYLMRQFSGEVVGGFGMERDLESLVDQKGPLTAPQKEKALTLAYKVVIIAQLAHTYPPETDNMNRTKKNWLTFSGNTHRAALALANAVEKNQNVADAADKLSLSCTKCHDVFKN
jgi:hypothetical protein